MHTWSKMEAVVSAKPQVKGFQVKYELPIEIHHILLREETKRRQTSMISHRHYIHRDTAN